MVKVRFTREYNYIPDGRLDLSVKYKAMAPDAEPMAVPRACADKAVAAGAAVVVKEARTKAKKDGENGADSAAG